MSSFLLVRAVSDRFIDAARRDPDLAFALLDSGQPPPEWHVNACRDHERRRAALANAAISLEHDAGELHDLGGAWDGLQRALEALAVAGANVFEAGVVLGEGEEEGRRALTSAETAVALAALEGSGRADFERAVRGVLAASRTAASELRWNPFINAMQVVRVGRGKLSGAGGGDDDAVVAALAGVFERLLAILGEARSKGFGVALQIVL